MLPDLGFVEGCKAHQEAVRPAGHRLTKLGKGFFHILPREAPSQIAAQISILQP